MLPVSMATLSPAALITVSLVGLGEVSCPVVPSTAQWGLSC